MSSSSCVSLFFDALLAFSALSRTALSHIFCTSVQSSSSSLILLCSIEPERSPSNAFLMSSTNLSITSLIFPTISGELFAMFFIASESFSIISQQLAVTSSIASSYVNVCPFFSARRISSFIMASKELSFSSLSIK